MFLVGYLFTVLNSGLFGHNRVSEQLLSSYWLFQLVCRVLCIRTTFVRRILRGWHSAPCCALGRYWRAFLKSHHACDIVNISENTLQYLTTYWAEIVTHFNAPYRYQILDFMRHTTASFVKQTTGRGFVHMFTFFYPHVSIDKVWTYRLLFVCVYFSCVFVRIRISLPEHKASGVKFRTAVHRRVRHGITNLKYCTNILLR